MAWDSISDSFSSALGFPLVGLNGRNLDLPTIWVLANVEVSSCLGLKVHDQQLPVHFSFQNSFHICTFFYASVSHTRHHYLWDASVLEPLSIAGILI